MQYLDQQAIKKCTATLPAKCEKARKFFGRPLTLTEKILALILLIGHKNRLAWTNIYYI